MSNILDQASSEVYEVAMAQKRADAVKGSGESAVLSSTIRCLSALDSSTQVWMKKTFDLCFMKTKQSIAFTKYSTLLKLKQGCEVDRPQLQYSGLSKAIHKHN